MIAPRRLASWVGRRVPRPASVPALVTLLLALLAVGALAQDVADPASAGAPAVVAPAEPGVAASVAGPGYGATPDALRPYRGLGEAAWRFYESPTPYRGPGRDESLATQPAAVRLGLLIPAADAPDGEIGEAIRRGVALRLAEANASAPFAGELPWELVVRYDSGAWGASSNTLVQLAYDDEVRAVLGSVDAAATHVALRVALKAELPMVNTASTDPTVTETAIPWILRCYPDDRQHGYRLARLVLQEHGHRRPAVLRVNDKYGRMGIGEFGDAARRLGFPLVLEVRHDRGEQDLSKQVQAIAAIGADAVVLWNVAEDGARAVLALRAAGLDLPVYGTERLVSRRFLELAGPAAEGVYATTPLDPTRDAPDWSAFVERYRAAWNDEPDGFAAFAYDGAAVLLASIEAAGLNRAHIRDELARLESFEGVTGTLRFDATHNNLGAIHVVQVRDGRFVPAAGP